MNIIRILILSSLIFHTYAQYIPLKESKNIHRRTKNPAAGTIQRLRDIDGEEIRRYHYDANGLLSYIEIKIKKSDSWIELHRDRALEDSEDDFYWNIKRDRDRIGSIAITIVDNSFYLESIGLDELSDRDKGIGKEVVKHLLDYLRSEIGYKNINSLYAYTHRPAIFEIFMQLSTNSTLEVGVESWVSTFSQDEIGQIVSHILNNESIRLAVQSAQEELFIEIEEKRIENTNIALLEKTTAFDDSFQVARDIGSGKWLLSYQNQPLGIIDSLTNIIHIAITLP